MQRKKWCSCNIFIYADNKWIICILLYYDILNCFETPNIHQNLEVVALKIFKELTQWDLVPLCMILIPINVLKHQAFTETLIWLPCRYFKGLNQWALMPHWTNQKPRTLLKHQTVTKTVIWLTWIQSINCITIVSRQLAPSPWPSTDLWGEEILISGLYTVHREFPITPEYKFQDKWNLI